MQSTYTPKTAEIIRAWYVIDARGHTLGRLATEVARILHGKHKPSFSPHMDVGDHVVILNSAEIKVTGKRLDQKAYYRHSNYPGGLRKEILRDVLAKHPDRVIEEAVRGMLPHNRLGREMIKKLRVYPGADHPHIAQEPLAYSFSETSREERK